MLTRTATPRLPGVEFLPPPAPAGAELPPLDVAAFAGFAERGPLDLPIAVEDASAYQTYFGGDLALAYDTGDQPVYAQLPGAVADFFANQGRRCYVVRVAGSAARAAQFGLPGLVALDPAGFPQRAVVSAANPGRWADSLALAARLAVTPLPVARFTLAGPRGLNWSPTSAPAALRRGDLLRLTFASRRRVLAPIADLVRPADPLAAIELELAGTWEALAPTPAPGQPVVAARLLAPGGAIELAPAGDLLANRTTFSVVFDMPPTAIGRGDVIELELAGQSWLLTVTEARRLGGAGSPLVEQIELHGSELLALASEDLPPGSPPDHLCSVERLRLAIVPRLGDDLRPAIDDLAFNQGHPRFWGEWLLIGSSMRSRQAPAAPAQPWLVNEPGTGAVRESRLPQSLTPAAQAAEQFYTLAAGLRPERPLDPVALAGLLAPLDSDAVAHTFLPIGMPPILTVDDFVGPAIAGYDDLGELNADLFLDQSLGLARSPAGLLSDARDRYDVQGLRLRGLHSLLVVEEVAMLAVPDASQRPWQPAGPEPAPDLPVAPPLQVQPCPELVSEFADCARPAVPQTINPTRGPVTGGTPVVISGSGFDQGGELEVFFGTRAATDLIVESDIQLRCVTPAVGLPGAVDLIVTGRNGSVTLPDAYTYQALSTAPGLPRVDAPADYDPAAAPLLEVQRALITICQARQDVIALLGLPAHFTRRECISWQQELRAAMGLPIRRVAGGDAGPLADLSYAAVYHPWLLRRDERAAGMVRAVSPEGAIAGLIAARERERGAWIAPANQPLRGVLGLDPALSTDDWAELFALQFNLIRREPRDFRPMSAHTLSDERSLLQVSVRRLLILLRKLAFERGMDFVFESNHERFREGTRALLRRMLQGLYERGAFAGSTPEQSYHVDTGPAVNPPQSLDQGRFVVEIRVAPSQPMEFISVVLTRADDGQIRVTESS